MNDSQNLQNAQDFIEMVSQELENMRKDCHEKMRLDLVQRIDWAMIRLAYATGHIIQEKLKNR